MRRKKKYPPKRPGRPRKVNLVVPGARPEPKPTGRDKGTERIQREQQWYAEAKNPALAAYPLGIMLANEVISHQQHEAGCYYAYVYGRVFGRTSIVHHMAVLLKERGAAIGDADDERALQILEDHYREGSTAIESCPRGRRMMELIENAVVYQRIPRWLMPVAPRPSDFTDAKLTIQALQCLVDVYRDGKKALDNAA